ncbi:MAG: ParA family protein [Magnetococcales bacterium]|nr:ParA family protein [Magnetococcales bacterium]
MGRIIAVANQKGGVGKTSTSVNLAAALAAAEKKILVVDFDPQGNATTGFGIPKDGKKPSIYQVLAGESTLHGAFQIPFPPFLSVVPSHPDLAGAEIELVNLDNRESRLRDILEKYKADFDFILVDCPPSLGLLTLNALIAADSVLIPLQCEFYAMEGLTQLMRTIDIARKRLNRTLSIEGIVLTMHDKRNNLSEQVASEVREFFGSQVYQTVIPRNVRVSEAPSFGKPVLWYDVRSSGSVAYMQLASEILSKQSLSVATPT